MSLILIRVEVVLFWSAATCRRFPEAQTSLIQLLAIPLSNPKTIAKWLVMRTPYKNMFPCSTGKREIIHHSHVAFIPDL